MKKLLTLFAAFAIVFGFTMSGYAVDKTEKKTDAKEEKKMEEKKADSTAAKDAPKVITTKSGLKYWDDVVGTGTEAAKGDIVDVHYTGWLYVDGKKQGKPFDSSIKRGTPISFQLGAGRMIRGWDEGLVGVKEGGKRTLIIPPDLGYGGQDFPPHANPPVIPANSTLIFECEMVKVTKK